MNSYVNMVKNKRCLSTNKKAKDFLPELLQDVKNKYLKNPKAIIDYWPKIIGEKLVCMTKVLTFKNKVLYVLVKSSTLYSVLSLHEKKRLLHIMQKKFSKEAIRDIVFKIG